MMRLGAVATAVFLAACGGTRAPAAAEPTATAATELPATTADAVRGALEQYRQAYEVRSLEALAELYAHSLDLNLVNQGVRLRGWTAVEGHLRELLGGADEVRVAFDDVVIAVAGAGAVATADIEREITRDATTVSERGVLTLVLREDPAGWSIIAEHFSFPLD